MRSSRRPGAVASLAQRLPSARDSARSNPLTAKDARSAQEDPPGRRGDTEEALHREDGRKGKKEASQAKHNERHSP